MPMDRNGRNSTAYYQHAETAANKIIDHVGKKIVLGVPLGIGKPIGILNALYRLAEADSSISLTIITGLTLARPSIHNELERRLAEPILARMLKDYEDPLYEKYRVLQQLPTNINVIEFFLAPGKYLHNNYVQQNYISSNYTDVVRDIFYYSINVIAQQVTQSNHDSNLYSLSCNSDLFIEAEKQLKLARRNYSIVAEVNKNLPFMYGDAVIHADTFTDIVDTGRYKSLFAIPREEILPTDHLIGLYTSCLIKDDSCLQIGIGSLSNAVASSLILRHTQNHLYHELLDQLKVNEKFSHDIASIGELSPFNKGLYASTEMLSDEYMQLYQNGILKKRVYDDIGLQKLLNENQINIDLNAETLDILLENKLINQILTSEDVVFLTKFGIFKSITGVVDGDLILESGERVSADLSSSHAKQYIINHLLGKKLLAGKIIHAAFLLGSVDFYKQLANLLSDELKLIDMTSVARTNTLSWSYELSKLQRQHARFVNSAMMVTLGGMVISDGLNNMKEVSGVGGQFDFVSMANHLDNARSIINCHSTKIINSKIQSNIVWNYSNLTIPRCFRDIVVTEYGIANLRSKTDAEIIKSMLNITDSRFQEKLLDTAKKYGKLPQNYEIPTCFQHNVPGSYSKIISEIQLKGYCKPYPFGSDLTEVEIKLKSALTHLKNLSKIKLIYLIFRSLLSSNHKTDVNQYLERMSLSQPKTLNDYIYKKILIYLLNSP